MTRQSYAPGQEMPASGTRARKLLGASAFISPSEVRGASRGRSDLRLLGMF
jgi:hypothetical protein